MNSIAPKVLRAVAAAMLACVLSNCASAGDPHLQASKNKYLHTRNTYIQGGLVGALVGAGVGAIVGNQSGHAAEGAAIGAGVGLAGGLMMADRVVDQRQAYANAAARLQQATQVARAQNSAAHEFVAALKERESAVKSDRKAALAAIKDANQVLTRLKRDIVDHENELVQLRQVNGRMDISPMQAQISALREDEKRISNQIDRLTQFTTPSILGKTGEAQTR